MTNPPLLDRSRLGQMDIEDLEILVHLFISICPKRQQALNQAWASQDHETIRFAAHSFKSSAVSMGLTALGEACFKVEDSNRHQPDLNPENINSLLKLIQPSIDALKAYLKS